MHHCDSLSCCFVFKIVSLLLQREMQTGSYCVTLPGFIEYVLSRVDDCFTIDTFLLYVCIFVGLGWVLEYSKLASDLILI